MPDGLLDEVAIYRLAFGMLDLSNALLGLAESAAAAHDALMRLHDQLEPDYDESEAAT